MGVGKPLAMIFHDLPELSGEFRSLLKELVQSAPDESVAKQVAVAADLTDTPMNEAMRRMAGYLETTNSHGRPVVAPEVVSGEFQNFVPMRRSNYLSGERKAQEQYEQEMSKAFPEYGTDGWERLNEDTDTWVARRARLEGRLGRPLTYAERYQLGEDYMTIPFRRDGYTGSAVDDRLEALMWMSFPRAHDPRDVAVATDSRKYAQAKMALEYLMGGGQ